MSKFDYEKDKVIIHEIFGKLSAICAGYNLTCVTTATNRLNLVCLKQANATIQEVKDILETSLQMYQDMEEKDEKTNS